MGYDIRISHGFYLLLIQPKIEMKGGHFRVTQEGLFHDSLLKNLPNNRIRNFELN